MAFVERNVSLISVNALLNRGPTSFPYVDSVFATTAHLLTQMIPKVVDKNAAMSQVEVCLKGTLENDHNFTRKSFHKGNFECVSNFSENKLFIKI